MIISKIRGGLGNQMFQYALAKSLSIRKDDTFKLDISFYSRPDGVIAILYRSGAFEAYQEAGLLPCLAWTETKYLVSMQDFVYESPNNNVLTLDNSNVSISLSLLLKFTKEKDYIQ